MKFDEIVAWAKEEAAEEATEKAKQNDILELLEEYGEIPEELQQRIQKESSSEILKKWLKLASKVMSIEEFVAKLEDTFSADVECLES